jgi:anion transporter
MSAAGARENTSKIPCIFCLLADTHLLSVQLKTGMGGLAVEFDLMCNDSSDNLLPSHHITRILWAGLSPTSNPGAGIGVRKHTKGRSKTMAAITEQLRIPSIKKELARLELAEDMRRSAFKPNVATNGWRYHTWLVVTLILLVIGGVWFGLDELNTHARLAFITFGLAVIGWSCTKINDTYIAMAAAITLAAVGVDQPEEFFAALGDATVWLLLASFVIAAAVKISGLSQRLTVFVATRTRSVNQLFYGLTAVLMLTAFVIPATSGRAALMLPIFAALSAGISDQRIVRALALLFPTIILLSAVASLLGAGAHLVTAEILSHMTGEQIGFGRWLMLGLPFALVSCFGSTWMILHLFLTRTERRHRLQLNAEELGEGKAQASLSLKEWYVVGIVALLILFWSTESWHGLNNTIIAVLGALAVTAPRFGAISFKDGIKGVEWNLVLFMAATLKLGEALIQSGGAEWLVTRVFSALQNRATNSSWVVIAAVAIISLLSHLFITSRTARSSVLIPLVVLFAASLGFNPTLLAFLSTAAAGFCLTLPVCAKPAMMFSQADGTTYNARDLLKLSSWLLPMHFILLLVFAFWIWPHLGLTIERKTSKPLPTWQNTSRPKESRQPVVARLSANSTVQKEN